MAPRGININMRGVNVFQCSNPNVKEATLHQKNAVEKSLPSQNVAAGVDALSELTAEDELLFWPILRIQLSATWNISL